MSKIRLKGILEPDGLVSERYTHRRKYNNWGSLNRHARKKNDVYMEHMVLEKGMRWVNQY